MNSNYSLYSCSNIVKYSLYNASPVIGENIRYLISKYNLRGLLFALCVTQLTNKLIACKADWYFNNKCLTHVLYANDIMFINTLCKCHTIFDVYYKYDTDNDILFNPIKSVCTIFKPKAYKRYIEYSNSLYWL